MEAMNEKGHNLKRVAVCGGIFKNPIFLREHANAMQCEVTMPKEPEAVLLGGAILAASASKHYSNIGTAMQKMCQVGASVKPDPKTKSFHDAKYKVHH
jgi:D-ribulokinase